MKSQRDLGIIKMAQFMFWSEWRKSNFNLSDLYYLLFLFYEKKIRVHLLRTAGIRILLSIIDLAFRRLGKGTLNSRIDGIQKKNPLKKSPVMVALRAMTIKLFLILNQSGRNSFQGQLGPGSTMG